eukprot:TRINITY_DN6512_c0_g1_i18.p1 TRINITY_DN6512_c0_g1~~TRINITY_DN6512_c0_g1_i18.p1  ORF type:complete len:239 (+),score=68.73 TRINITY_DN6512_c0_g1_i18:73-789(+)
MCIRDRLAFVLMNVNLGFFSLVLLLLLLIFLCMILLFLCNAAYLGLGGELKFVESTLYAVTYVYKHMQINYDNLREEIERLEKELQRIPKVKALFDKSRAEIGVLLFDDPSLLKDPSMSRACIGLRIEAAETLEEDFLEQLENASGLSSKTALEDTRVLTTKYKNKSSLTPTIGRLSVRKELKRLYYRGLHKELWNKGKLTVPVGEIYKENEIVYYVSLGKEGKRDMKLTQFKDPALS